MVAKKKTAKRQSPKANRTSTPKVASPGNQYLERFELDGLREQDFVGPEVGTRGRLLLEAVKLFGSRGYDACSVRELATAVGLGAPAIYNHYGSKQDVLVTAIDYILSFFFYTVVGNLPSTEPRARLFEIIRRHAVWTAARQSMSRASDALLTPEFMKRALPDSHRRRFSKAIEVYISILRELLDEVAGTDPEVDSLQRAYAVHELADRAGWWYDPDGRLGPDDVGKQTCVLAARMIGVSSHK
ncbi:MAG: TetR/AcrR family transcriptional regulator [Dehalococcoidia bacterium]